mmetsp:Transcript_13098/g.41857  ORF Transcript_13098/g.41857 Transcript_13098/m.41857 type:complete len:591 (-) Transcript_13098:375-2147(-)
MIQYSRGCCGLVRICQIKGSVFPFSFSVAAPCALLTAALRYCIENDYVSGFGVADDPKSLLKDNAAWSGFVFLVGFLVVFRTSQAYARFWDGCTSTHKMQSEWFNACSCLIAFCRHSKQDRAMIDEFKHKLVRLFSVLHALALADIEDTSSSDGEESAAAFRYQLIDASSLGRETLKAVKDSDAKVQLVFQWIQQLIVDNIGSGVLSLPPPIVSRAFQETASGMVAFEEAIKISTIPFPFPYAQTTECLLLMHWVCTPLVVAQWVSTPWWGAVFSFIIVFIYWSLNSIATELENPFGSDANDIDAEGLQKDLNRHLLLMLEPEAQMTPTLDEDFQRILWSHNDDDTLMRTAREDSLEEVWMSLDNPAACGDAPPMRSTRASRIAQQRNSYWGSAKTELSTIKSERAGSRMSRAETPGDRSSVTSEFKALPPEQNTQASMPVDVKSEPSAWASATYSDVYAMDPGLNGKSGNIIKKISARSSRQLSPVSLGAAMRKGDWQVDPAGADGGLNGVEASPSSPSSAGDPAVRQQADHTASHSVGAYSPRLSATGGQPPRASADAFGTGGPEGSIPVPAVSSCGIDGPLQKPFPS